MLNVPEPIANHVPPKPDGKDGGTPALRIRSLSKSFGKFVALDCIDLDIEQGEFVCFLGPSGCGKTTLLRAIAGLDLQDRGTIHQNGRDISRLPVGRRDFGIVFQSYALFPNLTVERNVGYGLHAAGLSGQQRKQRVHELLELVGLQNQAAKYPAQLSGGQQQRVALARALAPSPGLLLLDEPLSALDAQVRLHLRDQLRQLQRSLGVTTIMVTHDQDEALATADRIVVMNQGEIEQVGTPEGVFSRPASPFVAGFLGDMNFIPAIAATGNSVTVAGMTFAVPDMEGLAPGTQVSLCIRPADIAVGMVNANRPGGLEAVVETVSFRGNFYRLSVNCRQIGQTLDVEIMRSAWEDRGLASGSKIVVTFPAANLRVFPRRA
ncbi:iron(III) transport system ATP-binding protein [Aquamicrobium terrae]